MTSNNVPMKPQHQQQDDSGCDPRSVSGSVPRDIVLPSTIFGNGGDETVAEADLDHDVKHEASSDDDDFEYGESEKSFSPDMTPPPATPSTTSRTLRSHSQSQSQSISMFSQSPPLMATSQIPSLVRRNSRPSTVPSPIAIPNLTKKSRGRRVPTSMMVAQGISAGQGRSYVCKVKGCGKCFQRGEHLKRHIRSIHTNEKPYVCPQPGCGKDFSRHDNLHQHMRVHRNYSAPKDGMRGA
jgi:hypothetical protein